MDGYDILVGGLPPGTNNRKFQLYVEKQIEGRKIAKVGKLEDGRVGIMFSDIEGLQKFLEAEIKTYTFGGKTYELNYAELEPAVSKEEEKQESRMPDQASRRDQRDNDMWRRKLHVSNIPRHLHAYSAFRFHFERFGPLEKCFMESRKSYALITFMNHDAALQAKMYGVEAAPNIFMKIQWCRKEERQGQQQYQEPRRPPTSFHQSRSFHEQRHYPPGAQQYQGNPPYYRGPMPQDRRSSAENDPRSPERPGQYGQYTQGRLSRSVSSSALNFNLRYQNIAEDEGAYGGRRYEMDDLHYPQDADPRVENPPPLMSLPTHNPDANSQTESANSKPKPATRRKLRNKQKNKNPDGKNNQAENTLYQNIHYWTDLEELPAAGGTACVLAQNIDPSTDFQTVRMHFESKKRSGGGPVKSIIRMNDGFLITFQNQDDSDTCAQKTDQTFEEKELKIFSKMIPSYHERKFVIKGAGQKVTKGTLKMFLEACTKDEVEPSFCELQEIPGVYRVEYHEDEFDVAETEEFLSKIAAKELVGSKLTASRLLRSDCLKVTGVPPGASDDEIKLMFESKKRTDGGPVTSIERLKNNVVLVYFAQYTVAERIYNRFKKPCIEVIVIADKVVEVELFYHSLSKEYAGASKKKKSSAKTNGGDKEGNFITGI